MLIHARFIERFGTHVVVGVSMGGKDVLYIRQENPYDFQPTSLLKFLKDKASMRFTDSAENHCLPSEVLCDDKEVSFPSLLTKYVLSGFQHVHGNQITKI